MRRTIFACVIVALIAGATSATAANLITGSDIESGTINGGGHQEPDDRQRRHREGRGDQEEALQGGARRARGPRELQDREGPTRVWRVQPERRVPLEHQGPAGAPGPAGPLVPTELGVASVFVDRTPDDPADNPTPFGTPSVPLASPGVTTSGHFRFTCNPDQAPCSVSLGAAVISTTSTSPGGFLSENLDPIAGRRSGRCPMIDSGVRDGPAALISRVATVAAAETAMDDPLPWASGAGSIAVPVKRATRP